MKGLLPCLLLIASALAASAEYDLTIRSTIISSTCTDSNFCGASSKIAPSSFLYSNSSTSTSDLDAASASSSHKGTTLYAYDTVSQDASKDVTYTICDENSSCFTTTNVQSSTTLTTTIDGILTTIVTAVAPSTTTGASATVSGISTITNASLNDDSAATSSSSDPSVSSFSDAATRKGSTVYEVDTISQGDTFDVTRTICDENSSCFTTTDVESSTTLTTTVDGVLTTLVTAVPVSATDNKEAIAPSGSGSGSKKKGTTLYEIDTVSQGDTFDVTRTIYDENSSCFTTTDVESLTTLTTTVDGILTTLVTAVPVSATNNKEAIAASGSGSASSKKGTTLYEIDTVSQGDTFDVTRTICDENSSCFTTTDVESLTTLTTTVDGILTTLVTAVPVSTTDNKEAIAPSGSGSGSKKKGTTLYEIDTVSQGNTFDVTRTICDENSSCFTTTDVESLTTLTTTVDGILTTLVTAVPVSATNDASEAGETEGAHLGDALGNAATLSTGMHAIESPTGPKSVGGSDPIYFEGTQTTAASTAKPSNDVTDSAALIMSTETGNVVGDKTNVDRHGAKTDNEVITVTRTSCDSKSVCHTVIDLESSTTYTTTIDGVKTIVTTVCPISDQASITAGEVAATTIESVHSAASGAVEVGQADAGDDVTNDGSLVVTQTHDSTTVVTVTSCSENKCSKVPKTTGLTLVTVTQGTHITSYTTYCPLSESEETSNTDLSNETSTPTPVITIPSGDADSTSTKSANTKAHSTSTKSAKVDSASTKSEVTKAYSTVNVITNNIVTQSISKPTSSPKSSSGSVNGGSGSESISVYEGGAGNHLIKSTGVLGVVVSFLLMIL